MEYIREHQLNVMLALSFVCFVILFFLLMTNFLSREKKKSLIIFTLSTALLLIFDRYAYIYRGQVSTIAFYMAPICKYLVFFNVLNISYGFNKFLISLFKENTNDEEYPILLKYVNWIIIFGHFMLIISQFTNLYYSFDAFNNYHRESGYAICYLIPISATIVQCIAMAKNYNKSNRRIIIPIVLYFTLPIISSIIQLFIPGVSLANIIIAGVVIMLYSFTIYDSNMLLEEKKKNEADLKLASEIQQNEIPNNFPAFSERKDFSLYATMTPAKEVGGDFYDYFFIDDDHLCLAIADVSGKGVSAALNMFKTKLLLKGSGIYLNDPAKTLEYLNKEFINNNKMDMFVTVFFGIVELSTGKITFANAGHDDMLICTKKSGFGIYKTKHGLPVGAMDGAKYVNNVVKVSKGDKLFLYTDGVVDALNSDNKQYGIDNLLRVLNVNKNCDVTDLINVTMKDIKRFSNNSNQFDDMTMLCFELGNVDIDKKD